MCLQAIFWTPTNKDSSDVTSAGTSLRLLSTMLLIGWLAQRSSIDGWQLAFRRSRHFQQLRNTLSSRTWSCYQRCLAWYQSRREGWRALYASSFTFYSISNAWTIFCSGLSACSLFLWWWWYMYVIMVMFSCPQCCVKILTVFKYHFKH